MDKDNYISIEEHKAHLAFEENKWQQIYKTQGEYLMKKVTREIDLELEGLKDIADCLPENEAIKILRRIDRIKSRLQKLAEKE